MIMWWQTLFVAVAVAVAIPVSNENWDMVSRLSPEQTVEFTVALKQQGLAQLEGIALDVSNPKSKKYKNYLSLHEIKDIVQSPHADSVSDFLKQAGATRVEIVQTRDALEISMPSGKVESLFGVHMFLWQHQGSGRKIHRTNTMDYNAPKEIAAAVQLITGLHDFWEYPSDAKALSAKKKAEWAAASGSTAPDIFAVSGSESDLQASFVPYCPDGSMVKLGHTGAWECPNNVTVEYVTLMGSYKDSIFPTWARTWKVTDVQCSMGSLFHKGLSCNTPLTSTQPWRRVTVRMQVGYSGGTTSLMGTALPLYAPTAYATPETLRERYNIPLFHQFDQANSQSVGEFENEYINMTDLDTYFRYMGLSEGFYPTIHGKNDPNKPGGESTLDVQLMMGLSHEVPTTFWSVSGSTYKGGYILTWAMQVNNATHPPLVSSLSYSDNEYRFLKVFGSWDYVHRMETELIKMAARGLTVVLSAGDAGCTNVGFLNGDLHSTNPNCSEFRAQYPASSQWVTTVSATFLSKNYLPICEKPTTICDQVGEVPVSIDQGRFWTTGGGFSALSFFPQPEWQANAVKGWENWAKMAGNGGLPPSSMWNAGLRAYPDISTVGWNYPVVIDGGLVYAGGTSASAPIYGAIVALLNEKLLQLGERPLGCMNALLYQMAVDAPNAFMDVVVGRNNDGQVQLRGSAYNSTCPHGFQTAPGWDPVTGLGTPNFEAMANYIIYGGH